MGLHANLPSELVSGTFQRLLEELSLRLSFDSDLQFMS
jgi:hypothetical protein